jgi:hypothetical protein
VVGDKTLPRSVTQAWISEARTAEIFLSPMVVPFEPAESQRGDLGAVAGAFGQAARP